MARFVTSAAEFQRLLALRRMFIHDNIVLPGNVFERAFSFFRIVEYPCVHSPEFLNLILSLAERQGSHQIALMMIDPDPDERYNHYFREYGAIIIDTSDSPDEILSLCMQPPVFQQPPNEESPGDAFTLIVETLALFPVGPETPDWGVYRDRLHVEAGIVGFTNSATRDLFLQLDTNHITVQAHEAIDTFIPVPWGGKPLPKGLKETFLENYGGC